MAPFPSHVTTDKHLTLLDAIGDLITAPAIRSQVNATHTQYQIDSISGRTPTIDGITIPSNSPKNLELSNHTTIVRERSMQMKRAIFFIVKLSS